MLDFLSAEVIAILAQDYLILKSSLPRSLFSYSHLSTPWSYANKKGTHSVSGSFTAIALRTSAVAARTELRSRLPSQTKWPNRLNFDFGVVLEVHFIRLIPSGLTGLVCYLYLYSLV